jgi:structural maintenance of chromosome 2
LVELKAVVEAAMEKAKIASAECKRLEREMDDFKNNKDSKLKEIKVG